VAGDFVAAYELSSPVDTAASQLLAARAAADQAVYVETDSELAQEWLRRSETSAARAIELAPAGPTAGAANMALARAKGESALYRGALSNTRVPGELRALFERALELDHDNADALVALAAWHLELTERGVGWLYGASRDQVLPLMARGVAAAPEQVNLRVEYAVALKALGSEEEAREQLGIAMALPATTAADEYEQDRARGLLAGE